MRNGRKGICAILAAMLLAGPCGAGRTGAAEDAAEEKAEEEWSWGSEGRTYWVEYDYNDLYVGNPTPMRGRFFTSCWGASTTDLDVQSLIHGYSLVIWDVELGRFRINHRVVSGAVAEEDKQGNRTYHLVLQQDLVYSDGTPITAWDYAFSLLFQMDPAVAAAGGVPMDAGWMLGAEEYLSGESRELRGLRVPRDDQLEITVRAEALPYFYELSRLNVKPYPRHVIAPDTRVLEEGKGAYLSPELSADLIRRQVLDSYTGYLMHPSVSSGPYLLTEYDGRTASFRINDRFVGDEQGNLPRIRDLHLSPVFHGNMVTELGNGTFGLLNKVTWAPDILEGVQLQALQGHQYTMTSYPRTGMTLIRPQPDSRQMQDAAVRKALAICLNRDIFTLSYAGPYGIPVNGLYGIGQWTFTTLNTGSYPAKAENGAAEGKETFEDAGLDAENPDAAAWESLSADLENLDSYALDVDRANQLLAEAGWTLNEEGAEFVAGRDEVRCRRQADGRLLKLDLRAAIPETEAMANLLERTWLLFLRQAGIRVTLTQMGMAALEEAYRGQSDTPWDMVVIGLDFPVAYDPTPFFTLSEAQRQDWENWRNEEHARQAPPAETEEGEEIAASEPIPDRKDCLYAAWDRAAELAYTMSHTRNSDLLTYMQRWMELQEAINEDLPIIPLYSNTYFDFFTREIHDYDVINHITWGETMLEAGMSTAGLLEPAEEEEIERELSEMETEMGAALEIELEP